MPKIICATFVSLYNILSVRVACFMSGDSWVRRSPFHCVSQDVGVVTQKQINLKLINERRDFIR